MMSKVGLLVLIALGLPIFTQITHGLQSLLECDDDSDICIAPAEPINPEGTNGFGVSQYSSSDCMDRHKECQTFKENDACNTSPGWMIVNCPVSCDSCHLRDEKVRCKFDNLNISDIPTFVPGQINEFFEATLAAYEIKYDIKVYSTDPWIITLDNFMTTTETKALISKVTKWGRTASNHLDEHGQKLSDEYISSKAWCRDCDQHPAVARIKKKIHQVTNIKTDNYEMFQVLKYEVGQRYGPHFDYVPEYNGDSSGPRVLTFLLYLSDVEEGGETYFTELDVTIKPKRGMAVLFANTRDADPGYAPELRARHEAKPVIKGVKYAANAWIHNYNFRILNLWGCTGSFDPLTPR